MATIRSFLRCESGATAIEYGLIVGMIACVIIVSIRSVGTRLSSRFGAIANNLT